jgi:hypothetical protein
MSEIGILSQFAIVLVGSKAALWKTAKNVRKQP